jgi:hypothetical protein
VCSLNWPQGLLQHLKSGRFHQALAALPQYEHPLTPFIRCCALYGLQQKVEMRWSNFAPSSNWRLAWGQNGEEMVLALATAIEAENNPLIMQDRARRSQLLRVKAMSLLHVPEVPLDRCVAWLREAALCTPAEVLLWLVAEVVVYVLRAHVCIRAEANTLSFMSTILGCWIGPIAIFSI